MPKNNHKKFQSVADMLDKTSAPGEAITAAEFCEYTAARQLSKKLTAMRSVKGISQQDMAKSVGRSQSWVSKFENACDDDLTIGDVRAYMNAIGLEFVPSAKKHGATLVDEVKMLAFAIRKKLHALAETAEEADGLVEHIANFFGQTFFTLNRFLSEAAAKLPAGSQGKQCIVIEMLDDLDDEHVETDFEMRSARIRPCGLMDMDNGKKAALN